jgi:hypothetical protein
MNYCNYVSKYHCMMHNWINCTACLVVNIHELCIRGNNCLSIVHVQVMCMLATHTNIACIIVQLLDVLITKLGY